MVTLVIYDIQEDRIRHKVAEACKDYGLQRIQLSTFVGNLTHNRRQELNQRLRRTLGRKPGNIQVWVVCDKDMSLRSEIDVGPDQDVRYRDRYCEIGRVIEL